MGQTLIIIAVVILICLALNKISSKLGVPMLLGFILLGMVFGIDGIVKIEFDDFAFAETISTVALVYIIFYGGFGTNLKQAKPIVVKAGLLASVGVVLTALFVGLFCFLVLKFEILESFLIGAVISSTDAASVFSILRSKRLSLKDNTSSLLEVESGSNDPFSYMMTVILLAVLGGEFSIGSGVFMIFAQVIFGGIVGISAGIWAGIVLKKFRFGDDGFDTIFVFAVAIFSYALATVIQGNGLISAYLTGIVLGNNKKLPNKKSLVHFFDGFNGLMQMLLFFSLGLLSYPSQLVKFALPALLIALFLTFVARPIAVTAILAPFKASVRQILLVSWAGLRGAASIVFAIMVTISPSYAKNDIFHIVFFIVLFSVTLQGSLIPFFAKKLKMISPDNSILKTFNDYSDEVPVDFFQLKIREGHPWSGKKIKDIDILPEILIVLVIRDKQRIIPRGQVTISPGDKVVLSAFSVAGSEGIILTEIAVTKDYEFVNQTISNIKLDEEKLVVLVKRGNKTIIPTGKTLLKEHDVLVLIELN